MNLAVSNNHVVMRGLVPSIHVFASLRRDVDGRDKPCHDEASRAVS
jgi:hypothetical protein